MVNMDSIHLPYSDMDDLAEEVRFGYLESVKRKLHNPRLSKPSKPVSSYSHLLAAAIEYRHIDTLKFLLQHITITPRVVRVAAEKRSREALSILFQSGWGINQPLSGDQPSVLSLVLDDFNLVTWLLEQGADPNAGCDLDETPLSYAVVGAPKDILQLLLEKATSLEKGQLMHFAVNRKPSDPELITMLAKKGAPYDEIRWQDPLSFRFRGHFTRGTPLCRACKDDNVAVAQVLLDIGADPDKPSMKNKEQVPPTPRIVVLERRHSKMLILFTNPESRPKGIL